MTKKIIIIIPARLASTRLPNKPLAIIEGKTMIQRVYEQALKANLGEVVIATDGEKIANEIKKFGGKPLWITGDLKLNNTPTDSLGNVGYVDGRLDISNTNVSDISGIKVKNYVWDSGTPIERKRKARELAIKMADGEERRQNNEWSIDDTDDEGLKANALFKWLVGNGDLEELDDEQKEILKNLKIEL